MNISNKRQSKYFSLGFESIIFLFFMRIDFNGDILINKRESDEDCREKRKQIILHVFSITNGNDDFEHLLLKKIV